MAYFYWIAGTILALAWASRIVDAALGIHNAGSPGQRGIVIRFRLRGIRVCPSSFRRATKKRPSSRH